MKISCKSGNIIYIIAVLVFSLILTPLVYAQAKDETPTPTPEQKALLEKFKDIKTKEQFDALSKEEKEILLTISRPSLAGTQVATPEGAVNCFDYYTFGSVQVDLSPTLSQTVPGTTLTFSGNVSNNNPYPLIDGQVYVKIFKKGGDEGKVHQNGYALVDQFALDEVFTLVASSSRKTTFSWKVPSNAEGGEYMAAFFFQTAKQYNLLGLSFTDDVTGNQAHFAVTNPDTVGTVAFNKNKVTLNDTQYRFAAFPPHFNKTEMVEAAVPLTNPKNETVFATVNWKLYSWDGLREEKLKDQKTDVYKLNPKETRTISFSVPPIDGTVSYLVAQVTDGESKSILDIRFVRDDIEEMRINFPSILKYPLTAGEENTVFSCIHSTNMPIITGNTLTLTLTDDGGNVIHTYTYQGDVTGDMMGLKDTFVPEKTYTTFTLTALLEHSGSVFEKISIQYDCTELGAKCIAREVPTNGTLSALVTTTQTKVMLVTAVILSILGSFILYRKRPKPLETTTNNPE